jgi:peptidyl-prolyl cis-trans isomerase A (cyclophilin A)
MAASTDQRQVEIKTEKGAILLSIDVQAAPITAGNFLAYVRSGLFDRSAFYRIVAPCNQPGQSVPINVVQGGWREDVPSPLPPIEHEPTSRTGLHHRDGTLSMARLAPGTAAAAFFICVGDHPELDYGGARNPDGQGFAAFGHVVEGMDVVRAIWAFAETEQFVERPIPIHCASLAVQEHEMEKPNR